MDVPGTELAWAGEGVERFSEDVLEATFTTLSDRGLSFMQGLTPVDSGELRDSEYVQVYEEGGRVVMQIGAEAGHAIFVELGTSKMSAQPFIRPTFDWLQRQVPQTMRAESEARGGGG
jgi:HK97 gp10 family phage protein